MTENACNIEWSEKAENRSEHAPRKFYDVPENLSTKFSFPVKPQKDPQILFPYFERNVIGREYKFVSPYGTRTGKTYIIRLIYSSTTRITSRQAPAEVR